MYTGSHIPEKHFPSVIVYLRLIQDTSYTGFLIFAGSLILHKEIRSALEKFDAVLELTKLPPVQLSIQEGIIQLRALWTLNHLFYSIAVSNFAMPLTNYRESEINGEWRMVEMLNSCIEKSSITKKAVDKRKVWYRYFAYTERRCDL